MKRLFIITVLLSIFIACGGGRDEPAPKPPAPDQTVKATTLLTPTDKQLCAEIPLSFTWQAVQYATKYKITILKVENGQETTVISQDVTTPSYSTSALEKGKLYKWKVETTGPKNTAVSTVQQFQTESVAVKNYAPFAPELISPTDGGTYGTSAQWNCTDPDGDALTYEVFLGTSKTTLASKQTGLTAKSFAFTRLTSGTTYYWRVTATDTQGNKTIGQIWSFKAP